MSIENYDSFIAAKVKRVRDSGFEPMPFTAPLFDWQKQTVAWAIRKGRAAMFQDCGLGKTIQQLEWAHQVSVHTGGPVVILTPLAVAEQTIREAQRFGIPARIIRQPDDVAPGVCVTNYEKLDRFDAAAFSGVVLDESSILKNFSGKTRIKLTEAFSQTPYRLCCTATPSPNDYTEIGQHADFLGICSPAQMLATWFINDTFNTGDWRLKRHASNDFWHWVASWAVCMAKPSDIGFSDDGFILPALNIIPRVVDVDETSDTKEGELFRVATCSATSMHKEMRITCKARVEEVARLVNESDEAWLVWCNTNYEADELVLAIPDAIEVRGSDKPEHKETKLNAFADGKARVLITKPGIAGYGMNYQHCHNLAFVGLSYSFEDFYQALRRSYRFGQTKEVNAYVVQARTEEGIAQVVKSKMAAHEKMQAEMKKAADAFRESETKKLTMKTDITIDQGDDWKLYNADCVRAAKLLNDNSIHFSIFSPPFADLFTYSDDLQDMGNCNGADEFMEHFGFLIDEIMRVMMPGREVAVHCVDLLSTKWKHGKIEFQDFSGMIVNAFRSRGFLFHSRICIWKSPVTEMQRTKAHGLLYKTLCKDSADSRVGSADYLLVFRKPGENPEPITRTPEAFPLDWWQETASPVWMTIDQGNVLNGKQAKSEADERHVCPLQLDVIERAVVLWSNPGDVVYSPFAGIGSEGFQSLKIGRRFVGSELKPSYFKQAADFLRNARAQQQLFAA